MVNKSYAMKCLELFSHVRDAPPPNTEGGQRQIKALATIFSEAATDQEHADRITNHLLAHSSFFPKAPEIHSAADATRMRPPDPTIDTSWEPVTEEELASPEFLAAARALRCRPEDLFGRAGTRPVPLLGFVQAVGKVM